MSDLDKMRDALKPFADAVFNDNGDVTVDSSKITTHDYARAYRAFRALPSLSPGVIPIEEAQAHLEEAVALIEQARRAIIADPLPKDGEPGEPAHFNWHDLAECTLSRLAYPASYDDPAFNRMQDALGVRDALRARDRRIADLERERDEAREHIRIHAGDTLSLDNEVEGVREQLEEAEASAARLRKASQDAIKMAAEGQMYGNIIAVLTAALQPETARGDDPDPVSAPDLVKVREALTSIDEMLPYPDPMLHKRLCGIREALLSLTEKPHDRT